MRSINTVDADKEGKAGIISGEKLIAAMARRHAELVEAGALLDAFVGQPESNGSPAANVCGERNAADRWALRLR